MTGRVKRQWRDVTRQVMTNVWREVSSSINIPFIQQTFFEDFSIVCKTTVFEAVSYKVMTYNYFLTEKYAESYT